MARAHADAALRLPRGRLTGHRTLTTALPATLGRGPRLDLLRHGQALPAGPAGDRQRALSPAGVSGLESLAAHLAREAWRPDRVFSSPYLRALQSAGIVAGAAAPAVAVETLRALEPEREPSEVLDALVRHGVTAGHVLVVGHQPLLGLLVGHLTGVEQGLSPGMLVRVHCPQGMDQGSGRVTLTLAPKDLEHRPEHPPHGPQIQRRQRWDSSKARWRW